MASRSTQAGSLDSFYVTSGNGGIAHDTCKRALYLSECGCGWQWQHLRTQSYYIIIIRSLYRSRSSVSSDYLSKSLTVSVLLIVFHHYNLYTLHYYATKKTFVFNFHLQLLMSHLVRRHRNSWICYGFGYTCKQARAHTCTRVRACTHARILWANASAVIACELYATRMNQRLFSILLSDPCRIT